MGNQEKCVSVLFTSEMGHSISFYVESGPRRDDVVRTIIHGGGTNIDDLTEVDPFTVILVEKDDYRPIYDRVVFSPDYVIDCAKKSTLLPLCDYCHFDCSDDFFDVIFFRTKMFAVVGFRVPDPSEASGVNCTRKPYSRDEDLAIILYLVRKKELSGLRSNVIWKHMEERNVIQGRSWQSLKNHFLKSLVPNLQKFTFLTEDETTMFRLR